VKQQKTIQGRQCREENMGPLRGGDGRSRRWPRRSTTQRGGSFGSSGNLKVA